MQDESVLVYGERYPYRGFGNGEAYCVSQLPWDGRAVLVVPARTVVRRGASGDSIKLYARKTLLHCCQSPGPLNIHLGRDCLGLALCALGPRLFVGQYGEWTYSDHGGACLDLLAQVPPALIWERGAMLAGPGSLPHGHTPYDPDNRFTLERYHCYWYGETEVGDAWEKIPGLPDPQRTAASVVFAPPPSTHDTLRKYGVEFEPQPTDGHFQLWTHTTQIEAAIQQCRANLKAWFHARRFSPGDEGMDLRLALDTLSGALRGLGWTPPLEDFDRLWATLRARRASARDLALEDELEKVVRQVRQALVELLSRLPLPW